MSRITERLLFMALGALLMLGALVFLILFGLPAARTQSAIAQTTAHLMIYRMATTNFFATAGRWPTSAVELLSNSTGVVFIHRPSAAAGDAWGRQIIYEPYDTGVGYGRVISYGRDGKLGGVGADADIEQRFP